MGVEFKLNFDPSKWAGQLKANVKRELEKQALLAAGEIKIRTHNGYDVEGQEFKPYSPRYKAWKERVKEKPIINVDLDLSGDMQKAIHSRIEESENYTDAVIYCTADQTKKVRVNEERGRKFFGLSKEQVRSFVSALRNTKLIG